MRRSFLLPFLCCLLVASAGLFAQTQSVAGVWMGTLVQPGNSAPFDKYRLRVELSQDGVKVSGTSFIHLASNQDYYAKMRLEGRFEGGVLTYHEVELLGSNHEQGWGWCLKRVQTTIRQNGQYLRLEGDWRGYMDDVPCDPGTLTLEKLNPQAKPEPVAPAVVKTPVTDVKGDFGAVMGRKVSHRKEVPVYQEKLKVYVWDGDKVDGDIISLQYNGQWLLRKYAITKEKKLLELEVVPGGDNQLVLFAENQGQYPPNTAAITFFDGKQERNLSLSSEMSSCGALRFVIEE